MSRINAIQEDLVNLYLRLNGYFTTGFIVHSSKWGNNKTEIDALGVRFPENREPARKIHNSAFLNASADMIDFVVCEVKSSGQALEFNSPLRHDIDVVSTLVQWIGVPGYVHEMDSEIMKLFAKTSSAEIPAFKVSDKVRIRAFLCSPDQWRRKDHEPWFISGEEIFGYIWQCLCPGEVRDTCSTVYSFGMWGEQLGRLVKYFKKRQNSGKNDPGTIQEMYEQFGVSKK